MPYVGTDVSVHEGISGHIETSVRWSEVAAALDDRRETADHARDLLIRGIGITGCATVRAECESDLPVAQEVSRRPTGKPDGGETPSRSDHERAAGGSREGCRARATRTAGDHRDGSPEGKAAHRGQGGVVDHACGDRVLALMIGLAAGTRIWIVAGVTDLRRGFVGLSGVVQTALEENPFSGQVFIFRGKRGDLIKVLWWDGDGLCLFAKRLERGRFIWPQATSGTVSLTPAQLSMLLEGIDWRRPVRTQSPQLAV